MQFGGAATIEGNLVLGKEYTQDNIDAAGKNWGSYTLSDGGACELSGGSLLVKGSEYIATDSSAPSSLPRVAERTLSWATLAKLTFDLGGPQTAWCEIASDFVS
jgi:hypothetical protein